MESPLDRGLRGEVPLQAVNDPNQGAAGAAGQTGQAGQAGQVSSDGASDRKLSEREEQLAKVAFFDGLTREGLRLVAQVASEERHVTGTLLFKHGDPGDKLYILVDGQVRISREVPGVGEEALAVLHGGDVFGEMALIDEGRRSADARVNANCRVLVVTRDAFEELLYLQKDLAYEVLWNCVRLLTARLRETNDKVTFLSATGRF
jgi:CRP-like cAMP-binding protein